MKGLRLILVAAVSAGLATAATASARSAGTITLHAGQSKKVGRYTVICTKKKVAKKAARIVLHPGFQVTIGSTRVRCVAASSPKPVPTPSPTPTPTPAPPVQGTRSNPWPLGSVVTGPLWQLRVNSVNFDAWPQIAAANEFNDPPPPGAVDVLVNLSATYTGPGSANLNFDFDIDLGLLGSSNILYQSFRQSCGVSPDPNDIDFGDIYQGGTATYNQCWQVPATDVPSLELVYTKLTNGFVALR